MEIRLATLDDIPALHALEARYFVNNLSASERTGGYISVQHSQQWFTSAIATGGIHVATTDTGSLAGFIAITAPPSDPNATPSPILQAMVDLAQTLDYNGTPIAAQRYAFRGPVLIDEGARGHGLYSRFNAITRQAYADIFDTGVLFVSTENPRSVHTTTTKLQAESLTVFEVDGKKYHFMAFSF